MLAIGIIFLIKTIFLFFINIQYVILYIKGKLMQLRDWVVHQTEIGNFACMERCYEHISEVLGVGTSSVRQWVSGQRRISGEHVLKIEKITDGVVTRNHLRSDLYPD